MYIVNGIIKYEKIPNETVLHINISNDGIMSLLDGLPQVISEYKKHITTIELSGSEGDMNELLVSLQLIHKSGLKTGYETMCDDPYKLIDKLLNELDYVYSSTLKAAFHKEYSPFEDCEVWEKM